MREILFRGKTVEKPNEWIEGCNINTQNDMNGKEHIFIGLHYESKFYPLQKSVEWKEVIPETVGQYTGFTDINGKKVFEGDIVEVLWKDNVICVGDIRYDEESCRFVIYEDYIFPYGFDKTNTFKVIGNKWDNPELLEVQDER